MSTLFASLQTASAALDAFSQALGASQTNISNSSTAGYAAIKATIQPIDLSGDGSSASDFVTLSSTGSSVADALVQTASSQASASQTTVAQLTPVNQLFDITGASEILAALQNFSSAFSSLSVSPNDSTLGAQALTAASGVASAFQTASSSLTSQSQQIDSSIQSTTQQINSLAVDIRQLNSQAAAQTQFNPGIDASVRSDLDQLSSLVDITVTQNPDGAVSVLAGGEIPLVIGNQSYTLSVDPTAAAGSQVSSAAGGTSPATFSGQLGALLNTQNGTINSLLGTGTTPGSLNTLASGFATQVNALLSSGVTASGASGVPIFTFDPANAAESLALDPSVTPDQLGLATTGSNASSNGIANQLAALPSSTAAADQISGDSAEGFFSSIAASVGQQLSNAQTASTADQTTLTSAQTTRQQNSGVSLDQEAVNITTYQRSYEASAQVVSILDQLTSDEVHMIDGTSL
jgi:flagellar hook-associated protein 1 FlgK